MLGRLHRLGLDQELSGEADRPGVIAGDDQHAGKVFLLPLHIGVQQAHIPFPSAPEDVVQSTELDVHIQALLDLNRCPGDDVEVGIGRRPVHVAGVGKHVGRVPKKLDAGGFLAGQQAVGNLLIALFICAAIIDIVEHVDIMERIERSSQLGEKLERRIRLGKRIARVKGEDDRGLAERIASVGTEGVPIGGGEAQMLRHRLISNPLVGVIVLERQRVS